ncbi:MAG: acyloxyacyl hydrolase [Bacteroidales bacterium]|nr:acyloxyacyl hydrolase [Bacteroidales bacterium]
MKKIFGHTVLLLCFLLIINTLSAKTNDTIIEPNLQIEFRASHGFIICHHPEMKVFSAHFPLFELSVDQVTFGRKSWQSKSNYPTVGVSFLYTGIGEQPELGRAFAIIPRMTFNCLKSERHQINFKLGIGIGYLTQKYDVVDNPKNTFIGSHVNAAIDIAVDYSYMITNRLGASAFLGFTHFSNGSSRTPNNGINIAHAGIGVKYFLSEPKQRIPKQQSDNQQYKSWEKNNLSFTFAFTYSLKDIDEYLGYGKSWSVYNIQINALKRLTEMSKIGVGCDLVYDNTDKEVLRQKGIGFTDIEILKPGISAAYELAFGNTSFIFNFGCHIAGKDLCEGRVYQKLGMMQNIGKGVFATISLTTHYGWADYIGFGIGYRIH